MSLASIAVRSNGEADVAWIGPAFNLIYSHAVPGGAWESTSVSPIGTAFQGVSMAVRTTGEVDVVTQGQNGELFYFWITPGSTWAMATIAPAGSIDGVPSLAVRPTGEADIVAKGRDGSLRYYWATPGSAWSTVTIAPAGTTFSPPAIAVRPTGEVDVVVQGPNNELLYYYWAAASSGAAAPAGLVPPPILRPPYPYRLWVWSSATIAPAGTTFSTPAIAVRPTGEADVVAQGPNNSLEYHWATPGSGWSSATIAAAGTSHAAYSGAAIAVRPTGEADVVINGGGGTQGLSYLWADPGTQWWQATIYPAVMAPNQLDFNSGYIALSSGTPVGGHCEVVINSDGTYTFSGSVHNSSLLGNPYNYTIVMAVLGGNGAVQPFAQSGSVTATDSSWNFSGTITNLANAWPHFAVGAKWTATLSVSLDVGGLLGQIVGALGTVAKYVGQALSSGNSDGDYNGPDSGGDDDDDGGDD